MKQEVKLTMTVYKPQVIEYGSILRRTSGNDNGNYLKYILAGQYHVDKYDPTTGKVYLIVDNGKEFWFEPVQPFLVAKTNSKQILATPDQLDYLNKSENGFEQVRNVLNADGKCWAELSERGEVILSADNKAFIYSTPT